MGRLIRARATVNLEHFPAGSEADVDPADPRTAALLRTGLLVSDEWSDEPPPTIREPRKPKPPRQPDPQEVAQPEPETPDDEKDETPVDEARREAPASNAD